MLQLWNKYTLLAMNYLATRTCYFTVARFQNFKTSFLHITPKPNWIIVRIATVVMFTYFYEMQKIFSDKR